MRALKSRSLVPAAIAFLLLAGIYTSVVVVGQTSPPAPTQGQLEALVAAAQTSRAYAVSAISIAASHGLAVASAEEQVSQGDSAFTAAQTDAQSGSNITGGIQSAQAAMSDYTSASTSASVVLADAKLTAYVNYTAAVAATGEVNATAVIVASAAADVCGSAGAGAGNSSAFTQACADLDAQLAAARLHLRQAGLLLIQISGQANATASLSEALSLVGMARGEVAAGQSDLATIASYSYSQRGRAYVDSFIVPLSAHANATIKSEESFQANLTAFKASYSAYTKAQASASESITSSASLLATAISLVDTTSLSSSIDSSQAVAGYVQSNMTALLGLSGIDALPSVVANIHACEADAATYTTALASAKSQSNAYSQTNLSLFSAYLSLVDSDSTAVQTSGNAVISSCQTVETDLSSLLAIPGVQAISNALASLNLAGSVSGVSASLDSETTAQGTVKADLTALNSIVLASTESILNGALTATGASLSAEGTPFLNATASAALAQAATSIQATAGLAQSFASSANASLESTVGAFSQSADGLGVAGASLTAGTSVSATAITNAAAYVNSDTATRVSEAASGQADVSQGLQLLASLNVSGGAAALAQASLELQAASSVSA